MTRVTRASGRAAAAAAAGDRPGAGCTSAPPGPAGTVAPHSGAAATVTVYPDGPLVVRGDVEIRDLDGVVVEKARTVALCRCGRSAVKPLCDGSHSRGTLGPRPA